MIAIHGRMYTVGAIASPNITVGAYTSDLTVGDTIMLYSNVGKPTGSAVIKTIVSVPIPPGIDPNSYDSVFGNQFGGYAWWRVRSLSPAMPLCLRHIWVCAPCVRMPAGALCHQQLPVQPVGQRERPLPCPGGDALKATSVELERAVRA